MGEARLSLKCLFQWLDGKAAKVDAMHVCPQRKWLHMSSALSRNVKGSQLIYTHTFQEGTTAEILQAGNSTLHTTWQLPVNVTFEFERNHFAPFASYSSARNLVSNGVPEIRVCVYCGRAPPVFPLYLHFGLCSAGIPVQDIPVPRIRHFTPPFNYSEEFELDCVDRQDVASLYPGGQYYRGALPCDCDPDLDTSCFFCESSGRFYLLRQRQNMEMPTRVVNFSMYVNGDVHAPYATAMGMRTNITVQVCPIASMRRVIILFRTVSPYYCRA